MDFEGKRFVIGVDLGTTNSAVSFVDLLSARSTDKTQKPRINIFRVPQLSGVGEVTPLSVLPSFHYIPGEYDISKDSIALPWNTDSDNFSGAFARDHGAKVPSRLVSSAKSWLCHNKADRKAKILPWGSGTDVAKISPVDATSSYLKHVKNAWNYSRGDDEELYLENQVVVITVPASFDEVARDLTVEAAKDAGIHTVTLLEEPLAAFYSWLIKNEKTWGQYVKPNDLILVCDVGGGTTDFTLITLREVEGSPRFERLAVGDHLILGGDNIDLALARHVESKFKGNKALTADRWKTLCHKCREAKEQILDGKTDLARITLMGDGASLISGTLSSELSREELDKIIVEGFFPFVREIDGEGGNTRKGITEFGLPYEQEPAITQHLGRFLEHHAQDVMLALGKKPMPDLILFNGGALKPEGIQDRIRAAIRHWFGQETTDLPLVLENPDPDLSVALGASYYGLVKTGNGVRVGSGSPRAYYLGISQKGKAGDENLNGHAVCLVERGLDEGSKIELAEKSFEVITNQPVGFEVLSSSYRSGDKCGDLVTIDDTLTALPPIQTIVKFGKKGVKNQIPIRMEAEYTEMGTLFLWCRSLVSNHRWRLQFQLRSPSTAVDVGDQEVYDEDLVQAVRNIIKEAFSTVDQNGSSTLLSVSKTIVNAAGQGKEKWPLGLIRAQADELVKNIESRKLSADHELRWLNLTGFCMRPGFGDAFDDHRIRNIWKIYRQGPAFARNLQARSEWWILWRRIAGGLKPGQQRQFIQDLRPIMMPKRGVRVKLPAQEQVEIWMAVANMERLIVKDKVSWGRKLLSEIKGNNPKPQHFWSLSRIGARDPLYGSVDRVVPPVEVSKWIEALLSGDWSDHKAVGQALAQLGRKTGDRTRDIDPDLAGRIIGWMDRFDGFDSQKRVVSEVVHVSSGEEKLIFGESLPSGIVLMGADPGK